MNYEDKDNDYYGNPREDIFRVFRNIKNKNKVLEIGCGFGALGLSIFNFFKPDLYDGIELNNNAKNHLIKAGYDNVCIGDAFQILKREEITEKYDVIIMADVLEHIADDTAMLELVSSRLSISGVLILSVPNITNWQTIRNLYVKKRFPRDSSGIFDSTHLRWYTKNDIINLCTKNGFKLISYNNNKDCFNPGFDKIIRPLLELFHKELFVSQHLLLLQRV
jgi:predicted TPR repeat methyltransferase